MADGEVMFTARGVSALSTRSARRRLRLTLLAGLVACSGVGFAAGRKSVVPVQIWDLAMPFEVDRTKDFQVHHIVSYDPSANLIDFSSMAKREPPEGFKLKSVTKPAQEKGIYVVYEKVEEEDEH